MSLFLFLLPYLLLAEAEGTERTPKTFTVGIGGFSATVGVLAAG